MKQTEDDGNDDGLREHGISMLARRLILSAGEDTKGIEFHKSAFRLLHICA